MHFTVYEKKCLEKGISLHHQAIPPSRKNDDLKQATLDPNYFLTKVQWTAEGLLAHIVEMIVAEDESFRLVEAPSFRRLLQYQHPLTGEWDIPHCTKVRSAIMKKVEDFAGMTKECLANVPSKISSTFDTWTSDAGDAYMVFTIHYINAPKESPNDWSLTNEVLALPNLKGSHSGANQAEILIQLVDCYGFKDKCGWVTGDSATVNDRAVKVLAKFIDPSAKEWKHKDCLEHIIHLACQHFIKSVLPTSVNNIKEQIHGFTCEDISEEDEPWGIEEEHIEIENEELNEDFGPADIVGKALAAVEQAFDKFCLLADDSDQVPKLRKKRYINFKLSRAEWTMIELMQEVLAEPFSATQSFSNAGQPSLSFGLLTLEYLQYVWENFVKLPKFKLVKVALEAGLKNLNKWYKCTDNSNAYFICLVLDLSSKLAYVEEHWDHKWLKLGKIQLETVFDAYYQPPAIPTQLEKPTDIPKGMLTKEGLLCSGPQQELEDYLTSPLEEKCNDVVWWWGQHQSQYPTQAHIARDYLAIQASAVASERTFSSAGITGGKEQPVYDHRARKKARPLPTRDSGCEGIMISSDFVRANKLPKFELEKPVILQLACVGSKFTVQYGLNAKILLGNEKYDEYFDIANVDCYNVILGTPFLRWFEILLDFKNNCVRMGKLSFPNRFGSITPTEADKNEACLQKEKPKALPTPTSK
ncbi:hypothetical protein M422DRAFT_244123 [Sphaerobolus stellatus SS14]|nr:hypothetical protein M422DRAFT_244123 [Sphaerobolus stellatus SS14]